MTWQYHIKWHNSHAVRPNLPVPTSIVFVTSKPRSRDEQDLINIKTWINGNATNGMAAAPITVYVSVNKGDWPVLDARVTVKVRVDDEVTGNVVMIKPLEMLDDGFGGNLNLLTLKIYEA